MSDCPCCGAHLANFGDRTKQEAHVRKCLEEGEGSISSGRYLGAFIVSSLDHNGADAARAAQCSTSRQVLSSEKIVESVSPSSKSTIEWLDSSVSALSTRRVFERGYRGDIPALYTFRTMIRFCHSGLTFSLSLALPRILGPISLCNTVDRPLICFNRRECMSRQTERNNKGKG